MVTVIASKEELTTPANNGVNHAYANEHERTFQFIKDYQEVNFHRTASCKPLPEDLFGTVDGQPAKTSIEGTFFVQIDAIQPFIPMSKDQKAQTLASNHLLLSLTDGITHVQAVTSDSIPNLSFNTKIGSKLLLTETILVQNGVLQLTQENTRFQNGSSTYPRPRQPYRGRGNGPYRPSYEGRRNPRYENEDGETTFRKGPPPKNTLMDFMTSLKISNTDDSDKVKERPEKRRYHNDNNNNNSSNNVTNNAHYANHQAINNNYPTDQIVFQQEGVDETEDLEDDPTHANHRERRNPLPPRLQRAQEERSRRSTSRFYEEGLYGTDLNGVYATDPISGQPLSSLTYGHDPSYMHANPAVGQQHNPYAQGVNGNIPGHLAYYQANPNSLPYNLAAMANSTYSNQQPLLGHSYPNEHLAFCYGAPYGVPAYLPAVNGDSKVDGNSCPENDGTMNAGSQNDENNDSGIKSESSSTEQKQASPPTNEHEGNSSSEKRREGKPNQRIRWKVGDICQARWSEDGKFYPASVVSIQPPYSTVMFLEYYTYERVHFADMKAVTHEQPMYPYAPPMTDLNVLAANGYYAPRSAYYPAVMDGCLLMPEAPPFPFNSAGTLYMYPPPVAVHQRPARYNGNGPAAQATRRNENGDGTLDSASPPSKDSNDASVISSMTASSNDDNQQQDLSLPRPCSIADAPLTLVTSDDLHERSSNSGSTASSPSSKCDEKQKRCEGDEEEEEEPKKKQQQQPENN